MLQLHLPPGRTQITQDLSLYRIPEDLEPLTQILKGILDQTHSTGALAISKF